MNNFFKVLVIVFLGSLAAQAEVPKQISYQGVLKDSAGAPVADGVYAIKFRIYNDSVGGSIFWETAGFVPVQTSKGLFQHILGSSNSLPDSLSRYPNQWVGITVNLGSELSPRTRLVSVPFSFKADHSDTADISLDKTIDAGELTVGTLDTARYSAYNDLVGENKIGSGANQVAAGNHSHPHAGDQGSILRIEDTTTAIVHVQSYNDVLLKSISIPAGEINNFFQIIYSINFSAARRAITTLRINGDSAVSLSYGNSNALYDAPHFTAIKLTGSQWLVVSTAARDNSNQYNKMKLDISSGVIIEI